MPTQTLSAEELVDLINEHISELGGRATPTAAFTDIEVDSLICVELVVFLGQRYHVDLEEYEIASAENFTALAELISERMAGGGSRV